MYFFSVPVHAALWSMSCPCCVCVVSRFSMAQTCCVCLWLLKTQHGFMSCQRGPNPTPHDKIPSLPVTVLLAHFARQQRPSQHCARQEPSLLGVADLGFGSNWQPQLWLVGSIGKPQIWGPPLMHGYVDNAKRISAQLVDNLAWLVRNLMALAGCCYRHHPNCIERHPFYYGHCAQCNYKYPLLWPWRVHRHWQFEPQLA